MTETFLGEACKYGPHLGEGCRRYVISGDCIEFQRIRTAKYHAKRATKGHEYYWRGRESDWGLRYGIKDVSGEAFNRTGYIRLWKAQGGKCGLCELDLNGEAVEVDGSEVKVGIDILVDHNHETGIVRALVHKRCNILIGEFTPESARRLDRYLGGVAHTDDDLWDATPPERRQIIDIEKIRLRNP